MALLLLACCAGNEPAPPQHLLLVTLDTTRPDRLGCYGRAGAGTPQLDALCARGLRFSRAYAQAPLTLPSHLSILTGRLPQATGVHVNGQTDMAPGIRTLAEMLSAEGFLTVAAVGGFPLMRRFPASRGFERFDDRMTNAERPEGLERDAGEVVLAALHALGGADDRRKFLWVHLYDPHDPYDPPSPFRERFGADPYQGEIARVDAALGELLEGLVGIMPPERTLICVLGDHGEALGEHGEPTHGFFIYDATMRVPLILAGPGIPPGRVSDAVVQTVDIAPTLLSRLGLAVPEGLDGRVLDGRGDAAEEREALLESDLPRASYGYSALRGIVAGRFKLIDAPRSELYDLTADPDERHDLAADLPEERERLRSELVRIVERTEAGAAGAAAPDPRLASLGYLGGGARTPGATAPADPKDRIGTYVRFVEAGQALERGDAQRALMLVDALLAEEESTGARFKRATALRVLGRLDEAAADLDRVAASDAAYPGLHLERTYVALARGDAERAEREADAQLEETPDHPEVLLLRGAARERLGRVDTAERDYRRALELNPAYRAASLRLAALLVRAGRIAEARERLARHLADDPHDALARGLLDSLGPE